MWISSLFTLVSYISLVSGSRISRILSRHIKYDYDDYDGNTRCDHQPWCLLPYKVLFSISPHSRCRCNLHQIPGERDANSSIMVPISAAAVTVMVVAYSGVCFRSNFTVPVPFTTAASTYRFLFHFQNQLLCQDGAYFVQLTAVMAITPFRRFCPSIPAIANAIVFPEREINHISDSTINDRSSRQNILR